MSQIDLKPILVSTGSADAEGRLAMADGQLVAVLVRLDDPVHGDQRGCWFLEVGFGPCGDVHAPPIFGDLNEAAAWIGTRLTSERSSLRA